MTVHTLDIQRYLETMVEKQGTDLFLNANAPIRMKHKGQLVHFSKHPISAEATKATAFRLMNEIQRKQFEQEWEVDFSIATLKSKSRFRVNAFWQQGTVALVMRRIPANIPELEELGLPEILKDVIMRRSGLILMAGAMGSGKSTTIAAMLNHRNKHVPGHILAIEDPIEFIHPPQRCVISQRELGVDTHSYPAALKSAMREAPDVLMIGEVRETQTMQALLEIANTGILAISTLHARNTYQALQRVLSFFPPERHEDLFQELSLSLVCSLSQRLVMDKDGKQRAVMEVMLNNSVIADLIAQGKIAEIKNAMANSSTPGIQLYDDELLKLSRLGVITLEEALDKADSRVDIERRLNFG